ncbi:MAG: hypothetical protein IT229_03045, partial [Flavobacteriales bacterium]|nr:hypothetical protein [Flavobacteriales bacterium]
VRLLNDGTPDPAFGTVVLPSGSNGRAFRLAFAPDSSVYVCGYADTLGYETFTLWRVLPSGALDATFGNNGRSSAQIGSADARARGLAVQTDGKVVLAGYESSGFGRDGVLVRFDVDGGLDSTFNGDGVMVLSSFSELDQLDALTIMDDGSLIAGGYARVNNYDQAILIKVTPTGALDTSFGTLGVASPAIDLNNSRVYGVAVQGTEVLAAGVQFDGSTSADLFITKRNASGGPVISFGTFGVASIDVQDDDWMDDMELLPDGRIAFTGDTGSTAPGGDIDFLLGCYLPNGQPDLGFGTGGHVITETSPNYEGGFGVCLQPDGKLVVVGFGGVLLNSSLVVLRYANDLTTSLAETSEASTLTLWPNPARDQMRIRSSTPGSLRVEVLDVTGRLMRSMSLTGLMDELITVDGLEEGHYLLRTVQGTEVRTTLFIVMR